MSQNTKIAMIVAAGAALDYKEKSPKALNEEVMRYAMKKVNAKDHEKIIAIATVTKAIEYWNKNPRLTKKEVMQMIMNNSDEIISSVDKINSKSKTSLPFKFR